MLLENDDDTVLKTLLTSNFSPPKTFLIGLGVWGQTWGTKILIDFAQATVYLKWNHF